MFSEAKEEFSKQEAVQAIGNLAFNNPNNQDAIRKVGGTAPLVDLFSEAKEELTKQEAAWALGNLAYENTRNQDEIRVLKGIVSLNTFINSDSFESFTEQQKMVIKSTLISSFPELEFPSS